MLISETMSHIGTTTHTPHTHPNKDERSMRRHHVLPQTPNSAPTINAYINKQQHINASSFIRFMLKPVHTPTQQPTAGVVNVSTWIFTKNGMAAPHSGTQPTTTTHNCGPTKITP